VLQTFVDLFLEKIDFAMGAPLFDEIRPLILRGRPAYMTLVAPLLDSY